MDTRTANREAPQVGLGVIEERICALALMDELSDIDSTVMPFPLHHALGANGGLACFHAGSRRLDDSVGRTKCRSMSPRGYRRVNDGADCGVRRPQEIGVRGAGETVRNCQ